MLAAVTVLATLLPVAYYIYVGLRKESRPESLEDYFVYGRKVSAKDFANTAVGYALQMAALFLFADWGIRYGFGAFWVPLFWGIGFLFLYVLIPRFAAFVSGSWTLHGYLNHVSKSRALQVVAAIATVIGLWGTMMVEIEYATSVFQPFFTSEVALYGLGIVFLTFAFIYIAYGGYKAEVNTERVQVPVAYATLLAVVLVLVLNVFFSGYRQEFWILTVLLLFLFVLMITAKVGISPGQPFSDRQIFIPAIGIGLLAVLILVALMAAPSTRIAPLPSMLVDLPSQIRSQGVLSLLSLFFANALWQFVDISSWQRISSVRIEGDEQTRYEPLRRGIWRVMIESPVSWGFGVVFGMSLRYSGFLKTEDDPAVAISNFASALTSGQNSVAFLGSFSWLLYPVFVAAVIAIMLSTVTALISAITFTAFRDFPPFAVQPTLTKARLYALGVCVVGAFVYFSLRHAFGVGIQSALYTFYSSQIALFPTVLGSFYEKRINGPVALASIVAGIITTFVSATLLAKYAPDLALVPPLFTLIVSSIVYVLGTLLVKRHLTTSGDGENK
jgi:Na+/proline symporter